MQNVIFAFRLSHDPHMCFERYLTIMYVELSELFVCNTHRIDCTDYWYQPEYEFLIDGVVLCGVAVHLCHLCVSLRYTTGQKCGVITSYKRFLNVSFAQQLHSFD